MKNVPALRVSGPVLFALFTTLILLAVPLLAAPQDGVSEKSADLNQLSAQSPNPERFPAPPDDIIYPEVWVKSCNEKVVETYWFHIKYDEPDREMRATAHYFAGPAPWMTVSPETFVTPPEVPVFLTVTLNPGGAICPPAGTAVALEGAIVFGFADTPGEEFDSILVKTVVADTVLPTTWDTVVTGMDVALTVASNGNAGNKGIGKVNMDFVNNGVECDPHQDTYLYSLSPVIMRGPDTYSWTPSFDPEINFAPVPGDSTEHFTGSEFSRVKTEMFVTSDSAIGMIKTWYAPTGYHSYVVEHMKIFSFSGTTYDGVRIGEWIDWDVPSRPYLLNTGYIGTNPGSVDYLWQQGTSIDPALDCLDMTTRFGISGLLGWYYESEWYTPERPIHTGLYGGFVLPRDDLFGDAYTSDFIPDSVWALLNRNELLAQSDFPVDLNMLLNFGSFAVSSDSLNIWTVHASFYDADSSEMQSTLDDAEARFRFHAGFTQPLCCGKYTNGITGNSDCDPSGKVTLVDITRSIDRVYLSKKPLCCEANADIDCDGKITLADITGIIVFVYHLAPPGESIPCNCSGW